MKHTTKYLYDLEPSQLIGMPYEEALKLKALSGRELLFKLVEPSYDVRDSVRIDAGDLPSCLVSQDVPASR